MYRVIHTTNYGNVYSQVVDGVMLIDVQFPLNAMVEYGHNPREGNVPFKKGIAENVFLTITEIVGDIAQRQVDFVELWKQVNELYNNSYQAEDILKVWLNTSFTFTSKGGKRKISIAFVIDEPISINRQCYLQVYNYITKTWMSCTDYEEFKSDNILYTGVILC